MTGAGTPKSRVCASRKSGGRPEIQAPPVAVMRPPFKIDNMPSVTTIDGMPA